MDSLYFEKVCRLIQFRQRIRSAFQMRAGFGCHWHPKTWWDYRTSRCRESSRHRRHFQPDYHREIRHYGALDKRTQQGGFRPNKPNTPVMMFWIYSYRQSITRGVTARQIKKNRRGDAGSESFKRKIAVSLRRRPISRYAAGGGSPGGDKGGVAVGNSASLLSNGNVAWTG